MNDFNYNVLIIGWTKFPFGSASASRVRTLAKGLMENGASVHVITTSRIAFRPEDKVAAGPMLWGQIKYETTNCYESQASNLTWRERLVNHISAVCRSWKRTRQLFKQRQCDAVYVYASRFLASTPIVLMARLAGVPVYFDICEWFPPNKYRGGRLNPHYLNNYMGRYLPRLTGGSVIAITTFIQEKYNKLGVPSIVLPGICDVRSFLENGRSEHGRQGKDVFVVMYAGIFKEGDGVDRLIDALRKTLAAGYCVRLDIVGSNGDSGLGYIYRQQVERDHLLRNHVRFLGRVSDEEYPRVLQNAGCLALPRSDCQITRAAFPNRLPEFLATGVPVLTTNVPDVPLYLDNSVHAEIVESEANAVAQGIIRLLEDPTRAKEIGRSGRNRCLTVFDYRIHTKNLYDYISAGILAKKADV